MESAYQKQSKISIENYHQLINERLHQLVTVKESPEKILYEAARYALLGEAKRLRPLFLLSILQGYNIPIQKGLDVACAIEMIHTYSLIHDDLPSMDNDDMRRGKPSLHRAFKESTAILAGDFLLTYAFQVIAECEHLSSDEKVTLIQTLSSRSGAEGLIGGQILDLAAQDSHLVDLTLTDLWKTASLFMCSFECAGHLIHLDTHNLYLLQEAGRNFGLAYQLLDDLIDNPQASEEKKEAKATTAKALFQKALLKSHSLSQSCPLLDDLITGFILEFSCMSKY